MMASTMTIPQIANLQSFRGPMPRPMPGAIPVSVHGMIPGTFQGQIPVTMQSVISCPVPTSNSSPASTVSPPIQTIRLPVVPVGGGCYNDGMEVVWHGEFSRLFSSFFPPHVWYLSITNSAPQEKWKFYRDSAKVRFCCQDCGNGWTSMKGRVTFWFHLNPATSEGFVQFKLYGQVCKKCNSGKFEYVMWYPEEVSKVMCNLYNKVGQTYYGFLQPPIRIDRRPGRPRNQHNAELCQACRDGECDQGRPIKPLYNYIQPAINLGAPNQGIPGRPHLPPNQMGPVNRMPVVIRQPPIAHHGHMIMQAPLNSSTAQIVHTSHSGPSLITAPVTLTAGVQPILTYSIVTGPVKESHKLAPVPEDDTKTRDTPKLIELTNGHSTPTPVATLNGTESTTNSATITTAESKPVITITIKSPMINGIVPVKSAKKQDPKPPTPAPKSIYNGTAPIKPSSSPTVKDATKKAPIVPVSATNGLPTKKEEMKQTKIPIVNGYAAAAAGKPMPKMQAANGTAEI